MTAAAIAVSSMPMPSCSVDVVSRATSSSAATPAQNPRDGESGDDNASDLHAREARRLMVAADGIDVAAETRGDENELKQRQQAKHDEEGQRKPWHPHEVGEAQ